MSAARSVRLFSRVTRAVLPRRFWVRFGPALCDTVHDRRHRAIDAGFRARTVFWSREVAGLLRLAVREWTVEAGRRLDRLVHSTSTPSSRFGWFDMLHTVRQDLVYAFRMILKTPVVSMIAVASLAVGIAANTTIFSVLNTWLLRPLPYPDADQLMIVWEADRGNPNSQGVSPGNFAEWQAESGFATDWIASQLSTRTLTGLERPEQVTVSAITPNLLHVLETPTVLGRVFTLDEGGAEDTPVAVVGETLWRNRFGADSTLPGRTITLDGTVFTVVGVLPETFDFLVGSVDVWTANTFVDQRDDRVTRSLIVTARTRAGITVEQAQHEMDAVSGRLAERYPETNERTGVIVETVRAAFPGPTDRGLIQLVAAVVGLVLIVAWVNVASLLLAKTDARHRELGIRAALGAGKGRIARQLLTESVVLGLIAGVGGLVLAIPGVAAVHAAMPDELPATFAPTYDGSVVAFGLGVALLAGLVFGISPVSQALAGSTILDHTRGGSSSRARRRVRSAFVVSEFALALTILIGAAIITDLFARRLSVDPGFEMDNLLTVRTTLPAHKYDTPEKLVAFADELDERAAGLPGVSAHALANALPRARTLPFQPFTIVGDEPPTDSTVRPQAAQLSVSPAYFQALGVSLVRGRVFTVSDRADAPPVAMVNQQFAQRFFPNRNAIGERLSVLNQEREIVGIAANVTQERLDGLLPIAPAVYLPLAQQPVRGLRLIFRTNNNPLQVTGPVQDLVFSIDPDQPVFAIQTMTEHFSLQLAGPRVMARMMMMVGMLALALAAIGIYGVMAYNVSLQSREIGIRMALGANPWRVLRAVTRQGASLAGVGLVVGAPLAAGIVVAVSRILGNPTGLGGTAGSQAVVTPGPVVTVSLVLAVVGLLASYLPARRAVRVDPVRVLTAD